MRQHPLLVEEFLVDWQRRQRIIRIETELVPNVTAQTEDSGFLHSIKLAPKIRVLREIADLQLRPVQFGAQREDAQIDLARTELARSHSVKAKLNGIAAHKFFPHFLQSNLRCFSGDGECLGIVGLVVGDPDVGVAELRIVGSRACQDEIDPAAKPKFASAVDRNSQGRLQVPFGRQLRPLFQVDQLTREIVGEC